MAELRRVLVTGARGNTGLALLPALAEQGLEPIAAVSGAERREIDLHPWQVRRARFERADEVISALAGVDGLFLMVPFHEEMEAWGDTLVRQARVQGVRFVVRLSGLAAEPRCPSRLGAVHGRIDRMVKDSGMGWCILRCNSFMQNFTGAYAGMVRRGALFLAEGEARACLLDTRDVAAVAAAAFAEPGRHDGRVYDLTGPQPLSNREAVDILSRVTGREIEYRAITAERALEVYRKLGLSPWRIEALDSLSRFIRDGHAARVSPAVDDVLGRPATTFHEFACRYRHRWL